MTVIEDKITTAKQHNLKREFAECVALCKSVLSEDPNHAEAYHLLGLSEFQCKNAKTGSALMQRAIELAPSRAEYYCNLGVVLKTTGQLDAAIANLKKSIQLNPEFSEAIYNLGALYREAGNNAKAIELLQRAIALKPEYQDAWFFMGNSYFNLGNFEKAIDAFRRLILINPNHKNGRTNLAVMLLKQKHSDEAIEQANIVLQLDKHSFDAHQTLGSAYIQKNEHKEAVRHLRNAIALRPNEASAYMNLGLAFEGLNRYRDGVNVLQHALKLNPNLQQSYLTLASCYRGLNKPHKAIQFAEKALSMNPQCYKAMNTLALCYKALEEFDKAFEYFAKALKYAPHEPSLQFNYYCLHLLLGNFEKGWEAYEWLWQFPKHQKRKFEKPKWYGEALQGKRLYLHPEQGFGDMIQFMRYLPLLKERGAHIIFESKPEVFRLLKGVAQIDELILKDRPVPEYDYHSQLMALPRTFKTTLQTIPLQIPYIKASAESLLKWQELIAQSDDLRVGICWQGNPKYRNDSARSIPLNNFKPLTKIEGIKLYSLQKGPGEDQLAKFSDLPIENLAPKIADFDDTAAIIQQLDLVISIDSGIAHLAGALGKPVWLLSYRGSEWRWLLDREDSPWYPTMKIYRQKKYSQWKEVISRVVADLQKVIRTPLINPR